MKILFATDHAGFLLKEELIPYVRSLGYDVEDLGADSLDEHDDYPDIIAPAARLVSVDPDHTRAIILGGSGQGEAIVANRFPHVRAIVFNGPVGRDNQVKGGYVDYDEVRLAREHNDANILSLGARFLTPEMAQNAVKIWLETPFSGDERHVRRIGKIDSLELL